MNMNSKQIDKVEDRRAVVRRDGEEPSVSFGSIFSASWLSTESNVIN